mmetsp:Transcript_63799/g.179592  ORF Transcript_63799/g.179592 Transcript_63799/m.179592 type:complete len:209 (-) Transcript_63799:72-698(-)
MSPFATYAWTTVCIGSSSQRTPSPISRTISRAFSADVRASWGSPFLRYACAIIHNWTASAFASPSSLLIASAFSECWKESLKLPRPVHATAIECSERTSPFLSPAFRNSVRASPALSRAARSSLLKWPILAAFFMWMVAATRDDAASIFSSPSSWKRSRASRAAFRASSRCLLPMWSRATSATESIMDASPLLFPFFRASSISTFAAR